MAIVKPTMLGTTERMNFAKINEVLEMPNLIEVQKNSYQWFLDKGLKEVFEDISPITDFSGNLILKFMEGVAGTLMDIIKKEIYGDFRSKIGGLLAKPAFRRVKKLMDYTEVGGAPLLGVQGAVVKAHGSSNAHAFSCAIGQLIKMIDGKVVSIIEKGVEALAPQEDA